MPSLKSDVHRLIEAISRESETIPFAVYYWDQDCIRYGRGEPMFKLHFKTPESGRRLLSSGSLGFGESYMSGEIDIEGDLQQLFRLATAPSFAMLKLSWITKMDIVLRHLFTLNRLGRAAKNISHHYDRGNAFYQLWLDKSMTYSCAYFRHPNDSLEKAQQQKYEHICKKLLLQKNDTLLDIGCGWGGMLIYAAKKYGVNGLGCTLSKPQVEYAQERIRKERLQQRIQVIYQDYRQLQGTFDKVVSIGMFEHVGKKYIPIFMDHVRKLLNRGGIGLLHTIGKEKDEPGDPWVRKYIFPGGYIPRLGEIIDAMGKHGLVPLDIENLRLHYARTLEHWAKRYEKNTEKITAMFDEKFVRMWRMFLNASIAGFRHGTTRLYQITFTHGLNNDLPWTREYLYQN